MNIIPFYFSASLQELIFVHIAQKTKFSVKDSQFPGFARIYQGNP